MVDIFTSPPKVRLRRFLTLVGLVLKLGRFITFVRRLREDASLQESEARFPGPAGSLSSVLPAVVKAGDSGGKDVGDVGGKIDGGPAAEPCSSQASFGLAGLKTF